MKARQTKQEKAIDLLIERIYYARCSGMAISVLDIGKVYTAGRAAHAAGQDMIAAIVSTVEQLAKEAR